MANLLFAAMVATVLASVSATCGENWPLEFEGNCYLIETEPKNYHEAYAACKASGGDLASVHSVEENTFIAEQGKIAGQSLVIGFHDQHEEGREHFKWSDGSVSEYTNWASGEPNDSGGEDCTEIHNNGLWNDRRCDSKQAFMCEKEKEHIVVPTCSEIWPLEFEGNCYFLGKQKAIYEKAEGACKAMGGVLSSIHSEAENNYIAEQAKIARQDIWIGLEGSANNFQWLDSSNKEFTNWASGEPKECTLMYFQGTTKYATWAGVRCTLKRAYMCKQDSCGVNFPFEFEGNCYYIEQEEKNYNDANDACKARGGALASIHSAEENNYIAEQATVANKPLWIGYHDQHAEGVENFKWMDGTPNDFTNWASNEPNDSGGGEDCTEIYENQTWNDSACSTSRASMCKKG